jgi:hypothetical protein
MSKKIRQLPAVVNRVETGALRFGDDWPGLFIRGDDCFLLKQCIVQVMQVLNSLTEEQAHVVAPYAVRLQEIAETIQANVMI